MARCPKCRHQFRTLDDEADMHACPWCGWHPFDEPTDEDDPPADTDEDD